MFALATQSDPTMHQEPQGMGEGGGFRMATRANGKSSIEILVVGAVVFYGFLFRRQIRQVPQRLAARIGVPHSPSSRPLVEPPAPKKEEPKPAPTLSAEDAYNIQFARGFWRAVGNDASGDVEWLLLGVVEELAPTVRLARFLDLGKNRIIELRERLEHCSS